MQLDGDKSLRLLRVVRRTRIRAEFSASSTKLAILEVGDVVEALEERLDENGAVRVRCPAGWTTRKTADGRVTLEELFSRDEDYQRGTVEVHEEHGDSTSETLDFRGRSPSLPQAGTVASRKGRYLKQGLQTQVRS